MADLHVAEAAEKGEVPLADGIEKKSAQAIDVVFFVVICSPTTCRS